MEFNNSCGEEQCSSSSNDEISSQDASSSNQSIGSTVIEDVAAKQNDGIGNDSEDDISSSLSGKKDETCRPESTTSIYFSNNIPTDSEHACKVKEWVERIPIGLGFCPWAIKSNIAKRLRYVTCFGTNPSSVANMVLMETGILTESNVPSLSSTLIACPNIETWNDNFEAFDEWIRNGLKHEISNNAYKSLLESLTLVAFHPNFLRWKGLPPCIDVGSKVHSHYGMIGKKSIDKVSATIVETRNGVFGLRKVKVRFNNDDDDKDDRRRQEQYVPIDWLELTEYEEGEPLPDNMMHQAPYPTIHLINNMDLVKIPIREISRVKRKNACRFMKLGWGGIQHKLVNTNTAKDHDEDDDDSFQA